MLRTLALLLLAVALAGCARDAPGVVVINEAPDAVGGTMRLYYDPSANGDLSDLRETWEFAVPGSSSVRIATFPDTRVEYHWLVVELDDGRRAEAAVHNAAHFFDAEVRIRANEVLVSQGLT